MRPTVTVISGGIFLEQGPCSGRQRWTCGTSECGRKLEFIVVSLENRRYRSAVSSRKRAIYRGSSGLSPCELSKKMRNMRYRSRKTKVRRHYTGECRGFHRSPASTFESNLAEGVNRGKYKSGICSSLAENLDKRREYSSYSLAENSLNMILKMIVRFILLIYKLPSKAVNEY